MLLKKNLICSKKGLISIFWHEVGGDILTIIFFKICMFQWVVAKLWYQIFLLQLLSHQFIRLGPARVEIVPVPSLAEAYAGFGGGQQHSDQQHSDQQHRDRQQRDQHHHDQHHHNQHQLKNWRHYSHCGEINTYRGETNCSASVKKRLLISPFL